LLSQLQHSTTPFLAHAEGTYVKASIGRSNYKEDGGGNEHATGASLGLGYVIDKNWDAEIGYTNFGTIKSWNLHHKKVSKLRLFMQQV
jgi:hypothetical protein